MTNPVRRLVDVLLLRRPVRSVSPEVTAQEVKYEETARRAGRVLAARERLRKDADRAEQSFRR